LIYRARARHLVRAACSSIWHGWSPHRGSHRARVGPQREVLSLRRLMPRLTCSAPSTSLRQRGVEIYRLRLANDEAISLQWSYIRVRWRGLDQHDSRPRCTILTRRVRDPAQGGRQTIRARVAEVTRLRCLGHRRAPSSSSTARASTSTRSRGYCIPSGAATVRSPGAPVEPD